MVIDLQAKLKISRQLRHHCAILSSTLASSLQKHKENSDREERETKMKETHKGKVREEERRRGKGRERAKKAQRGTLSLKASPSFILRVSHSLTVSLSQRLLQSHPPRLINYSVARESRDQSAILSTTCSLNKLIDHARLNLLATPDYPAYLMIICFVT